MGVLEEVVGREVATGSEYFANFRPTSPEGAFSPDLFSPVITRPRRASSAGIDLLC
ncbi:hypothetical protein A2U01_0066438 [Trifolium medium]|uniref:Uncharacterized protein n=1 Tax=Trifolium medium TaxID=97028 RepID=A0A392S936_9FABA|nr:hypothetical protein [Trifolium medium]